MKSVFITYNQALSDMVSHILSRQNVRGYTQWGTVTGRGSVSGEPHLGNHTWPAVNSAIMAVVEDSKVEPLLSKLKQLNESAPEQGLRAFVWNIEDGI